MINFNVGQVLQMTQNGAPFNINYKAYANAAGIFLCSSDQNTGRIISENNYLANFGGSMPFGGAISNTAQNSTTGETPGGYKHAGNGAFSIAKKGLKAAEYPDGLSNTVFSSERTKGTDKDAGSAPP